MIDTSGFYSLTDLEVLFASDRVNSPSVTLTRETKDDFVYPKDGWHWFDSAREAYNFLTPAIDPRVILPEDFQAKFTPGQLVQMYDLALTDNNVKVLLMKTFTTISVHLDSATTKGGLLYLKAHGVDINLADF